MDDLGDQAISLCMIVRDEEFFIEECLRAARPYVDEIVLADTGSVDKTPDIARRYADVFDQFEWINDYSAARNASLELATASWILVLDADEIVDPDGYRSIRQLVRDTDADGFFLSVYNYSDQALSGRARVTGESRYSRGYTYYSLHPVLRLFRNRPDIRFRGRIHEEVDTSIAPEKQSLTDIPIHHYLHGNPNKPREERVRTYLEMMEAELANRPDGRLYSIAAASALHVTREYEKACVYYLQAVRLGFQPEVSREGAAYASYLAGDFTQASALYSALYDSGIRSLAVCQNLGNLHVRAGNLGAAMDLLRECLRRDDLTNDRRSAIEKNLALLERRIAEG